MRHKSGTNQLKRYLGKKIPKNIEQLKADFLLEFYEWNPNFDIYYQSETKSIPSTIKLQNFEMFWITFNSHYICSD